MSLQSPLGRVLGLGSARSGYEHWWGQRISAVALVPLTVWLAISLLTLPNFGYGIVAAWVAEPWHGLGLILLLAALNYHSSLGVQAVVEDYVHGDGLKTATLVVSNFCHILMATAGVYAVVITTMRAHP